MKFNRVASPFLDCPTPESPRHIFTLQACHPTAQPRLSGNTAYHGPKIHPYPTTSKPRTVAGLKRKMDDYGSETDSDYTSYWRDWVRFFLLPSLAVLKGGGNGGKGVFGHGASSLTRDAQLCADIQEPKKQFISSRGNEYFCEIDEEYLMDRFNLTGLNTEVQYYQYALDLVTDVFDLDCDDEMRETIEKSARHLYGLVHARYIVTTRGLTKMVRDDAPRTRKLYTPPGREEAERSHGRTRPC